MKTHLHSLAGTKENLPGSSESLIEQMDKDQNKKTWHKNTLI